MNAEEGKKEGWPKKLERLVRERTLSVRCITDYMGAKKKEREIG